MPTPSGVGFAQDPAVTECIVHCKTLTRLRAQARGKANNSRPPITADHGGPYLVASECMGHKYGWRD
jgi:hypothetical protein